MKGFTVCINRLPIKWMLHRDGFYWPTMIVEFFHYYKGCNECQKFGNNSVVAHNNDA